MSKQPRKDNQIVLYNPKDKNDKEQEAIINTNENFYTMIMENDLKGIIRLINDPKNNLNFVNSNNETLVNAILNNTSDIMEIDRLNLIKELQIKNISLNNITIDKKENLLHLSSRKNFYKILEYLLDNKTNFNKSLINQQNFEGQTPLMIFIAEATNYKCDDRYNFYQKQNELYKKIKPIKIDKNVKLLIFQKLMENEGDKGLSKLYEKYKESLTKLVCTNKYYKSTAIQELFDDANKEIEQIGETLASSQSSKTRIDNIYTNKYEQIKKLYNDFEIKRTELIENDLIKNKIEEEKIEIMKKINRNKEALYNNEELLKELDEMELIYYNIPFANYYYYKYISETYTSTFIDSISFDGKNIKDLYDVYYRRIINDIEDKDHIDFNKIHADDLNIYLNGKIDDKILTKYNANIAELYTNFFHGLIGIDMEKLIVKFNNVIKNILIKVDGYNIISIFNYEVIYKYIFEILPTYNVNDNNNYYVNIYNLTAETFENEKNTLYNSLNHLRQYDNDNYVLYYNIENILYDDDLYEEFMNNINNIISNSSEFLLLQKSETNICVGYSYMLILFYTIIINIYKLDIICYFSVHLPKSNGEVELNRYDDALVKDELIHFVITYYNKNNDELKKRICYYILDPEHESTQKIKDLNSNYIVYCDLLEFLSMDNDKPVFNSKFKLNECNDTTCTDIDSFYKCSFGGFNNYYFNNASFLQSLFEILFFSYDFTYKFDSTSQEEKFFIDYSFTKHFNETNKNKNDDEKILTDIKKNAETNNILNKYINLLENLYLNNCKNVLYTKLYNNNFENIDFDILKYIFIYFIIFYVLNIEINCCVNKIKFNTDIYVIYNNLIGFSNKETLVSIINELKTLNIKCVNYEGENFDNLFRKNDQLLFNNEFINKFIEMWLKYNFNISTIKSKYLNYRMTFKSSYYNRLSPKFELLFVIAKNALRLYTDKLLSENNAYNKFLLGANYSLTPFLKSTLMLTWPSSNSKRTEVHNITYIDNFFKTNIANINDFLTNYDATTFTNTMIESINNILDNLKNIKICELSKLTQSISKAVKFNVIHSEYLNLNFELYLKESYFKTYSSIQKNTLDDLNILDGEINIENKNKIFAYINSKNFNDFYRTQTKYLKKINGIHQIGLVYNIQKSICCETKYYNEEQEQIKQHIYESEDINMSINIDNKIKSSIDKEINIMHAQRVSVFMYHYFFNLVITITKIYLDNFIVKKNIDKEKFINDLNKILEKKYKSKEKFFTYGTQKIDEAINNIDYFDFFQQSIGNFNDSFGLKIVDDEKTHMFEYFSFVPKYLSEREEFTDLYKQINYTVMSLFYNLIPNWLEENDYYKSLNYNVKMIVDKIKNYYYFYDRTIINKTINKTEAIDYLLKKIDFSGVIYKYENKINYFCDKNKVYYVLWRMSLDANLKTIIVKYLVNNNKNIDDLTDVYEVVHTYVNNCNVNYEEINKINEPFGHEETKQKGGTIEYSENIKLIKDKSYKYFNLGVGQFLDNDNYFHTISNKSQKNIFIKFDEKFNTTNEQNIQNNIDGISTINNYKLPPNIINKYIYFYNFFNNNVFHYLNDNDDNIYKYEYLKNIIEYLKETINNLKEDDKDVSYFCSIYSIHLYENYINITRNIIEIKKFLNIHIPKEKQNFDNFIEEFSKTKVYNITGGYKDLTENQISINKDLDLKKINTYIDKIYKIITGKVKNIKNLIENYNSLMSNKYITNYFDDVNTIDEYYINDIYFDDKLFENNNIDVFEAKINSKIILQKIEHNNYNVFYGFKYNEFVENAEDNLNIDKTSSFGFRLTDDGDSKNSENIVVKRDGNFFKTGNISLYYCCDDIKIKQNLIYFNKNIRYSESEVNCSPLQCYDKSNNLMAMSATLTPDDKKNINNDRGYFHSYADDENKYGHYIVMDKSFNMKEDFSLNKLKNLKYIMVSIINKIYENLDKKIDITYPNIVKQKKIDKIEEYLKNEKVKELIIKQLIIEYLNIQLNPKITDEVNKIMLLLNTEWNFEPNEEIIFGQYLNQKITISQNFHNQSLITKAMKDDKLYDDRCNNINAKIKKIIDKMKLNNDNDTICKYVVDLLNFDMYKNIYVDNSNIKNYIIDKYTVILNSCTFDTIVSKIDDISDKIIKDLNNKNYKDNIQYTGYFEGEIYINYIREILIFCFLSLNEVIHLSVRCLTDINDDDEQCLMLQKGGNTVVNHKKFKLVSKNNFKGGNKPFEQYKNIEKEMRKNDDDIRKKKGNNSYKYDACSTKTLQIYDKDNCTINYEKYKEYINHNRDKYCKTIKNINDNHETYKTCMYMFSDIQYIDTTTTYIKTFDDYVYKPFIDIDKMDDFDYNKLNTDILNIFKMNIVLLIKHLFLDYLVEYLGNNYSNIKSFKTLQTGDKILNEYIEDLFYNKIIVTLKQQNIDNDYTAPTTDNVYQYIKSLNLIDPLENTEIIVKIIKFYEDMVESMSEALYTQMTEYLDNLHKLSILKQMYHYVPNP